MNLNLLSYLISQNISTDLKGPKVNINCTMVDVRGRFLGLPHATMPAAVTTNENKKMSSFKHSKTFKRKRVHQTDLFRIINPLQ